LVEGVLGLELLVSVVQPYYTSNLLPVTTPFGVTANASLVSNCDLDNPSEECDQTWAIDISHYGKKIRI
jgi:hypothetical protein